MNEGGIWWKFDWWKYLCLGFYRAERYYRLSIDSGRLPPSSMLNDLDFEHFGHEFLTALLAITKFSEQEIPQDAQASMGTIWRDFTTYFVTENRFEPNKLLKQIRENDLPVIDSNQYQNALIALFIRVALYRLHYPKMQAGLQMVDINEDIDSFIHRLENLSGQKERVHMILSPSEPIGESDAKLYHLLNIVFELGKEEGRGEEAREAPNRARQQLTKNSDEQAERLAPIVRRLIEEKGVATSQEVANYLNRSDILTKNGNQWNPTNIKILIERINRLYPDMPVALPKVAFLEDIRPVVNEVVQAGAKTLLEIATALNEKKVPSKQGKEWHPSTVKLLLEKLNNAKNSIMSFKE